MGRWLSVLKEEARAPTLSPDVTKLPKYGFGDETSYNLIGQIVDAMSACGAVRHGAECFNFYFPQELDPDFLVVWDGFAESPPWRTFKEPDLRPFLLERAKEGYSFPINPVWPVRDKGWLEVLQALQATEEASANLKSWFPPESGVLERIVGLQKQYPDGFVVNENHHVARTKSVMAQFQSANDHDALDVANFADLEVKRETQARWRRIRMQMKMHMLSGGDDEDKVKAAKASPAKASPAKAASINAAPAKAPTRAAADATPTKRTKSGFGFRSLSFAGKKKPKSKA